MDKVVNTGDHINENRKKQKSTNLNIEKMFIIYHNHNLFVTFCVKSTTEIKNDLI